MLKQDLSQIREYLHSSPHLQESTILNDLPEVAKLLDNPVLKFILQTELGEGYHLSSFSTNTVRKGFQEVNWHTDYPGIQIIISIDDFTVENGATEFNYNNKKFRLVVPAGTMTIFKSSILHTQHPNNTVIPRSAILCNFTYWNIPAKDKYENVPEPFYKPNGNIYFQ